jgi:serine/threonine protein kinase/class 3 adenylate cyclase
MAELKTFLFTDISGSVRLKDEMIGRSVTERDQAFIFSILQPHRQRIEAHLAELGGRVVSTAGDGHFLVFDNTIQAAQWAVEVQESHRDDPIRAPSGEAVEVRISMHVGVPQIDPGDPDNFVGKSVDYAARLNDYATGGQILVSRSVMAILEDVGLEGIRLHLQGRRLLKGIGNVEVHELLYDDHGPRPMRNQPKSHTQRQWTVIPTMGFSGGGCGVSGAGPTALHRVGNYELEELLGSGGMGDVYKARHMQFGRVRAVKVIKQQFLAAEHAEVIRRFYNEIKAVGRLEHKNIVVAIDSSSPSDKVHYLVMEYIDGVSLDELVAQHGPLPIAEACEIIRQAARGLQYIYKHDMVHRDIKPSNLMVTLVDGDQVYTDSSLSQVDGERPVVKILDLGLALLADDGQDRLTRFEHKAMGTGMYMPPEQWKTTSVDIRADIYSLGCTLYHLLAGNPPFFDSDLRPEKAHEKSAVPPIRNLVQPLPKQLWDVLRKMLEKRPEDRYATPAEVSAALAPMAEGNDLASLIRGYEAGTTASAATPTKPSRASQVETHRSRPWFSTRGLLTDRRRVLNWLTPLVLMAIFAGGAYWLLSRGRAERERLAIEAEAAAQQQIDDVRKVLSSYATTAALYTASEMGKRFKVLEAEARDPELVRMLTELDADPPQPQREELLAELRTWIIDVADRHNLELDPESWFVQDARGIQVARSPQDKASYLKSYKHRDYFHGLGEDLDSKDETALAAVKPIEHGHLSSVYRSTSTGLMKIAFSVPVRAAAPQASDAADERGVIGVLAMSLNVHEFPVLDPKQAGGSEVMLVDLRHDWIDGENRGLILHHPKLNKGELARADEALLAKIDAAKPLSPAASRGSDNFLVGYRDPINPDDGQTYMGAVEPVSYELRVLESDADTTERFGWVVLVQRPMPAK